ncbi:MAG: hypothetical protein H6605_03625 [Flavobacteriales bacterium]|nr:hypothetical protein [Flavobacteriales bacterium]
MLKKERTDDYYFNEKGLLVFTKEFHLKRGFCCGNKCLHCPFGHENVPEISRSN